jgi:alpha-L-fucosidase
MNRGSFLSGDASIFTWAAVAKLGYSQVSRGLVADGPFQPDWESLKSYQCPDWYRDAKLSIWAHWSPQCVPEQGDQFRRRKTCFRLLRYPQDLSSVYRLFRI